jgi:hypothetical protein
MTNKLRSAFCDCSLHNLLTISVSLCSLTHSQKSFAISHFDQVSEVIPCPARAEQHACT